MHMSLPSALQFLPFAFLASSTSADNCYWRSQNIINNVTGWFACNNTQVKSGGAQLCCLNGAHRGEDSLCYMPGGTGGDEWFVGGCTDRTYGDPVCRGSCTGDYQTWIFYNATASKWQCCGNSAYELERGIGYGFPPDFIFRIFDLQCIDKREYQQHCFLQQQQ
ncbi:hypothetical protein LTR48_001437 [Friedmanniomyces endolithicus]|uniref:Cyanovirin-N domain-containing protein n=1 Tax=Rachicladosporium monterosium TaxID=1507873 RepID=A0ABR0L4N0_9PEZI|nr:hypothetical protein LTR48_001437 [Friedmanniomyces endolithicus]KAK5143465.1 hypothetical protein LTR32_004409 [Rachicladosporium monterosium]